MKTANGSLWLINFLAIGCASAWPKQTKLPTTQAPISSLTAHPDKDAISGRKSPFKTAEEENKFWQIINREVDHTEIEVTPLNFMAMLLGSVLDQQITPEEREEAIDKLSNKFILFSTTAEDKMIDQALADSADLEKRWLALKIIFKRDAEAWAALDYVLHDEKHIQEYLRKQKTLINRERPKNEIELPAPKSPDNFPTQKF